MVALYTLLGFKTGYIEEDIEEYLKLSCKAGLEFNLKLAQREDIEIVKSPNYSEYISQLHVPISAVIVPVRDLKEAADSRRRVQREISHPVPGGLIGTDSMKEGDQEQVLLRMVYDLVLGLAEIDARVLLISYPRFIKEPKYLYRKLKPTLKRINFDRFQLMHTKLIRMKEKYDIPDEISAKKGL